MKEHERCFFFQWIDGPEKFDPRYLLFEDWVCRQPRERFHRWVPPPPNPPEMTEFEKELPNIDDLRLLLFVSVEIML